MILAHWAKTLRCYSPSTKDTKQECANGYLVDTDEGWDTCLKEESIRVRCPKGYSPCNDLTDDKKEFRCAQDCDNFGGLKNCSIAGIKP